MSNLFCFSDEKAGASDLSKSNSLAFSDSWQRKQASLAWTIFSFPVVLSSAGHACVLNPLKPVQSFLYVWHRFAYSPQYAAKDQPHPNDPARDADGSLFNVSGFPYIDSAMGNVHIVLDLKHKPDNLLGWLSDRSERDLGDKYMYRNIHRKHIPVFSRILFWFVVGCKE